MKVIEKSRNVHLLKFNYSKGWEQWFFIKSDEHIDSVHCDRNLLKSHLDLAKERNAIIITNGDLFDFMQGRYDPRRKNDGLGIRKEYKNRIENLGEDYIDAVINDTVEFYGSYVDNLFLFGYGNHETSIKKNCHTDPLERFITLLNFKYPDQKVYKGGYSGYIKLQFQHESGGCRQSKIIKYHHGQRGNAQRSKGVLQVDIDSKKFPDADFIIKGDDHMKWHVPQIQENLSESCQITEKRQEHIRLGSYKKGISDGYDGWETEKSFDRTTLGGWFIKFYSVSNKIKYKIEEAK